MLHLARRVALGVDVRDLLQLERALERDRVLEAAAEVEEVLRAGELPRELRRSRLVLLEHGLDEARDLDEVVDPLLHVLGE